MRDKSKSAGLALIGIFLLLIAGHLFVTKDHRIGHEGIIIENIDFNGGEHVNTEFIEEGRSFQIAGSRNKTMEYHYNGNGLESLTVSMNVYYLNSTGLDWDGFGGGSSSSIEKFETKVVTMKKNEYQYLEFEDNYAIALVSVGEVRDYNLEDGWKDEGTGKKTFIAFVFLSLIKFMGAGYFYVEDGYIED